MNRPKLERKKKSILILVIVFILMLCWIPYLLAYFPGSVLGDSLSSIRQITGVNAWSNHHPVLYTLYVGLFWLLGELLHNVRIGVLLYSLVQMAILSSTLSYLLIWLYEKGIKKWLLALFLIFYIVVPIFPSYAIIMWKDPIYSCALLWMMLIFYKINETDGECLRKTLNVVKYIAVFSIVALFRNNGIYIVAICSLIICFRYKKKIINFTLTVSCFLLLYMVLMSQIYSLLGIKKESVEALGIPMQQMAAVAVYDGKMNSVEEDYVFQLLSKKEFQDTYKPCIVDPIKWHKEFNTSLLESDKVGFVKNWLTMLPKNLSIYVKAYALETYGFWMPGVQNKYGYIDRYIEKNEFGLKQTDLVEKITGISLKDILNGFQISIGSGTLAWLMLGSLALTMMLKKKQYISLLPAILNWLVILVATPVAFSLRYVFILAIGLPFMLCLPFISQKRE